MATNKTQSGSSGYLPEDLIRDILPRLPPRSLLRCRTVYKAWRRLATDRDIILNHHTRQPAQPLLTVFPFVAPHNNCLEAVDLSTNKRRMVARFVEREGPLPFSNDAATNLPYDIRDVLMVHASCDGLLLLSFHGVFFVCNPATRQGALLPLVRDGRDIAGFYKHAASGEYRMLYHQLEGLQRKYFVLTLGYQEARTVERHASSAAVGAWLARGLPGSYKWPPVLLHGCVHWPPQQSQDANILVFDPAAESFRLIAPPPAAMMIQYENYDTRLFEMEGTLAMFCWRYKDARRSDLWVLEDYEGEAKWVCRHRVELPIKLVYEPLPFYPAIAYPKEGDMLVPEGCDTVLRFDKAGQLQGSFQCAVRGLRITPHMLKESLVIHEFLHTQQSGGAGAWFSEVQFAADGLPVTGLPS